MRIFEIDNPKRKRRVLKAISKMDPSNPEYDEIMNYLHNVVLGHHIPKELEKSGIKSRISSYEPKLTKKGKISQSKTEKAKEAKAQAMWDWFEKEITDLRGPSTEDKVMFSKLIQQGKDINPEIFKKSGQGNLVSLIKPELQKNKTFQAMKQIMWDEKKAGQGGMGPGELFIIAFTSGARKGSDTNEPDIKIGDWKVELKLGGIVPPGGGGSNNIVDKLNVNLIKQAEQDGIYVKYKNVKSKPVPGGVSVEKGWFPELFKQYQTIDKAKAKVLFDEYFDKLYDSRIDKKTIDKLYNNLGTPGAARLLAPEIFRMYQGAKGFDSICIVDKDFNYVNITAKDMEDPGFKIPDKVGLQLKMVKGGDTNAVLDGHYIVAIGKVPEEEEGSGEDAEIEMPTDDEDSIDLPNQDTAGKDPKTQTQPPQPKVDPRTEQENQENEARGKMQEKLRDLNNPITPVYNQLQRDPMARKEIDDIIIDDILKGMSDQEIAAELNDIYVKESLQRFKRLIK